MSIGISIVAAGAVLLGWALVRSSRPQVARSMTRTVPTPLDEAERILTARYAAGLITPAEYSRARSVLRT
jgi:uncharacterized membrane protein